MDVQGMRRWTRLEPFTPFQIRCHDGAVYRIPALGLCMPCAREVVVGIPDARNRARHAESVAYDRIAAVEPLDETPAPAAPPSAAP